MGLASALTFDIETTVIGAGVIGLAVARELALSGREVLILEQHDLIGSETSSRNSEVIHAGIYYEHGSMKANSCVTGRDALYAFCQSNGVPHQRIGKLIVASSAEQLEVLRTIQSKAERNGVSDLTFVDRNELKALEPALSGAGALLSPSTGIIDSHAYMLALLGNAERYGAQLVLNSPVSSIAALPGEGYIVEIGGDGSYSYTSREVIVSAGLGSTSLIASSRTAMAPHMPSTMFAKGNYFRLTGRAPFSRLVYPVPEPGGLGIHLTLDMGGQARFGPDVEWVEQPDYRVNPARVGSFYNAIRRY